MPPSLFYNEDYILQPWLPRTRPGSDWSASSEYCGWGNSHCPDYQACLLILLIIFSANCIESFQHMTYLRDWGRGREVRCAEFVVKTTLRPCCLRLCLQKLWPDLTSDKLILCTWISTSPTSMSLQWSLWSPAHSRKRFMLEVHGFYLNRICKSRSFLASAYLHVGSKINKNCPEAGYCAKALTFGWN